VPLGIQYAACTVVGNAIGQNNVKKAKDYARYVIYVGITIELLMLTSLNLFKH
jgi:Na+-driven multidrug efflux pump